MPPLGIIEGRFGDLWSWDDRAHVAQTLAGAGYGFYHYGPKGDAHLRRQWRQRHSPEDERAIRAFAALCRSMGMRFGIALTPVGTTHPFDDTARADLSRRIAELAALGIDDLAILFDDLRGDLPELAARQAEVVHFCAAAVPDVRVYFCPTYYSDDPVLDRVFGARPVGYLEELGRRLDPAINIYWTGEEVCSRQFRPGHLAEIAGQLRRPVTLWDNYPVNDGSRMSRFLHLRAFTGRPAADPALIAAHAINPAIQPHLTCLPALTLPMQYRLGDDYRYGKALADAATTLFGEELGSMLIEDIMALQDVGLERLGERHAALRRRYADIDAPAAREVVRWLDGMDLMTDEQVRTQ